MKTYIINQIALTIALGLIDRNPPERDDETGELFFSGCGWRNGSVTLPDGTSVDCGGGWIENESSANHANEEAGIAGGLRQGVSYPNETVVGEYTPYDFGEDESGWESRLMSVLYGAEWEDREDADDLRRSTHATIPKALATLARS